MNLGNILRPKAEEVAQVRSLRRRLGRAKAPSGSEDGRISSYPSGMTDQGTTIDQQRARAEALAVWDWLGERIDDAPDNANNRFEIAAAANALFLPRDGALVEVWRCCVDARVAASPAAPRPWSGPFAAALGLPLTYLPCTELARPLARVDGAPVGGGASVERPVPAAAWVPASLTAAERARVAAGGELCAFRAPRYTPARFVVDDAAAVAAVRGAVAGVRARRGAAATAAATVATRRGGAAARGGGGTPKRPPQPPTTTWRR